MKRRRVLQVMVGSAGVRLAGCADLSGDEGGDQPVDDNSAEPETPEDEESTESDDSTPENEPPSIVDFDADPTDYGTALLVGLEGEDNLGIERVAISYGDLGIEESLDDTSVVVERELTDIHEANLDETPGTVVFALEDVEGEVTEETTRPHTGSPSVSIESAATPTPGELEVTVEATDELGLHWIQVDVNGNPLEKINAISSDETDYKLSLNGDSTADGVMNKVTATARNTFGSTQSVAREQYVRKFDSLEDQEIEIGAVYIPFMGGPVSKWPDCAVGTPDVGEYSHEPGDFEETGREATNRHIDQMRGHGISKVMFNFGEESRDYARLRNFTDTELAPDIEFECFYVISQALVRNRYMERDFEFIRENMLDHSNYSTIDGRPVVTFWWMKTAILNEEYRDELESNHGDFGGFVDYLREELTYQDEDPFLVADLDDMAEGGYWEGHHDIIEQFDGVTNWVNVDPGARDEWENRLEYMRDIYNANSEVSDELDVEFIPTVFPGFDDRSNRCWGEDRYLPRSSSNFKALLELADEYRTIDRINVATWNDWNEGHQIEPGTHEDTEYGTEYLEVIKEFAQGDS